MSAQGWIPDILRRELSENAKSLIELVSKLEDQDGYPTETPRLLCKIILNAANVVVEALEQAGDGFLPHIHVLLSKLVEHVRYIERARVVHTPWSIVQATDAFLKKYVGKNSHFIIRPQWSYNYGMIGDLVEYYDFLLSSLEWIPEEKRTCLPKGEQHRIIVISFPRTEKLNALLHANFGHEVGHIIASEWERDSFGSFWLQVEPVAEAAIRQRLEKKPPPVEDEQIRELIINEEVAEQTQQAMEVARCGLRELISDAVGAHLFGVAAWAAAAEVAARFDLDENPLDGGLYPPWRYRLRLVAEACHDDLQACEKAVTALDSLHPFVSWLGEIRDTAKADGDQSNLEDNPVTKIPYEAIEREWPSIRAVVLKGLPAESSSPFTMSGHIVRIKQLLSRLKEGLPPDSVGEWPDADPASLPEILCAGWAYKYHICESEPWSDNANRSLRLVLKAIESSFVQQEFGPQLSEEA